MLGTNVSTSPDTNCCNRGQSCCCYLHFIMRNYADVADAQCARFLPFSAETTGGLGKDAEELIDQISLACRDHLALPSHYHIANGVRASVAIAVQKGNALAMFGGYSRAVMHAGQPHAAA